MEPEPPRAAFFLPGAGADPIWSEPESSPGPRTSGAGAAKKGAAPQHCVEETTWTSVTNIRCMVPVRRVRENYSVVTLCRQGTGKSYFFYV